jgi:hypothetical protein
MKHKKTKTLRKLTHAERKLASLYIPEEIKTKQYPRKTAIAIGISRAQADVRKTRRKRAIDRIMARYK